MSAAAALFPETGPSRQGGGDGGRIDVAEIGACGQSAGGAADADAAVFQSVRKVDGRRLTLHIGTERENDFPDDAFVEAFLQPPDGL